MSITQCLNSVIEYESDQKFQVGPTTFFRFILNTDFQSLSLDIESLQIYLAAIAEVSFVPRVFRDHIYENQLHTNKQSIWQFGKPYNVWSFKIAEIVIVAVPALDRASTNNKEVFGQVVHIHSGFNHEIGTKYGMLDWNFFIYQLMTLRSTVDLRIFTPLTDEKIKC